MIISLRIAWENWAWARPPWLWMRPKILGMVKWYQGCRDVEWALSVRRSVCPIIEMRGLGQLIFWAVQSKAVN